MKKSVFLFLVMCSSLKSFADCAGSGIYFWPASPVIKQNSLIIIECYATSQSIINDLNTKNAIYLKSSQNKVSLTVKEICIGEFYLTQAVLIPDEPLVAGLEYELFIDNLDDSETPLQRWNPTTSKFETVKWKVEAGEDITKPTWTKKPNEEKKTFDMFGCGPAVNVHFNFAVYDESSVFIKANVTNLKTAKTTSFYLEITDLTTVQIGHDMCSGAFLHDEGKDYEISFDLMDASGNLTTWEYDKVKFTKPTTLNSAGW